VWSFCGNQLSFNKIKFFKHFCFIFQSVHDEDDVVIDTRSSSRNSDVISIQDEYRESDVIDVVSVRFYLVQTYFTTITKQVIQLILIMLVRTDVCVRMVFVWEETGVPGGNPPV